MKKQHLVTIVLLVLVATWFLYPRPSAEIVDEVAETQIIVLPEGATINNDSANFTVRVASLNAQTYTEQVLVRGRTQAFRSVDVRAEIVGKIVATPVARGQRVNRGDVLCEIAIDNRATDLQEARTRELQTKLEYEAAQDLLSRGLQSEVAIAKTKTALDSARATVNRAELAMSKTKIRAPFAGVMETRPVELGDLLQPGTVCATILDDNPMLLVGQVPEQDIGKLDIGSHVLASLHTGENVSGKITYISHAASDIGRGYRIEVEIEQSDQRILDGITAELLVQGARISAHLIPPSSLTLDDNGNIGVKILLNNNLVDFVNVEIVGEETRRLNSGVWVTGLPVRVNLITHGQEIVFSGQTVRGNFDWALSGK